MKTHFFIVITTLLLCSSSVRGQSACYELASDSENPINPFFKIKRSGVIKEDSSNITAIIFHKKTKNIYKY